MHVTALTATDICAGMFPVQLTSSLLLTKRRTAQAISHLLNRLRTVHFSLLNRIQFTKACFRHPTLILFEQWYTTMAIKGLTPMLAAPTEESCLMLLHPCSFVRNPHRHTELPQTSPATLKPRSTFRKPHFRLAARPSRKPSGKSPPSRHYRPVAYLQYHLADRSYRKAAPCGNLDRSLWDKKHCLRHRAQTKGRST